MVLTKENKQQVLEELTELLKDSGASIAANYSGLTSEELTELRKKLKESGIKLKVTKNTLVKRALVSANLTLDEAILDQPVFFAFGEDEVEVCKAIYGFAKEHENLEILGGLVRSETADASQIKVLALLPGRDELEAKLVGSLNAPIAGLANVLFGNIRGLVNVLGQYQKQVGN